MREGENKEKRRDRGREGGMAGEREERDAELVAPPISPITRQLARERESARGGKGRVGRKESESSKSRGGGEEEGERERERQN